MNLGKRLELCALAEDSQSCVQRLWPALVTSGSHCLGWERMWEGRRAGEKPKCYRRVLMVFGYANHSCTQKAMPDQETLRRGCASPTVTFTYLLLDLYMSCYKKVSVKGLLQKNLHPFVAKKGATLSTLPSQILPAGPDLLLERATETSSGCLSCSQYTGQVLNFSGQRRGIYNIRREVIFLAIQYLPLKIQRYSRDRL